MIRLSPTLELAQQVLDAQLRGERAMSFSTPTFGSEADALVLPPGVSLRLTPAAGLDELRHIASAEFYGKWEGLGGNVAITAGAKAACFATLRAVTKPGDNVLIIAPAWPSYEDICYAAGVTPVLFATPASGGFIIEAKDLQAAVAEHRPAAVIATSPNNPTGRIYSKAELGILYTASAQAGATLIIDESFSNICFDKAAWQSSVLHQLDRVAVINSFSKNFHLQGLRLGSVLAKPELGENIVAMHQAIVSAAPSPSQHLAIAYFRSRSGGFPGYEKQKDLAIAFAERLGWSFTPPQGTFYLFPKLKDVGAFVRGARSRGVHVLSGEAFGKDYADHVRFCFGKPLAELEEMFAALGGLAEAA